MSIKRFLSATLSVAVAFSALTSTVLADSTNRDGINDFILRMYDVCLDRTPDNDGLNYWSNLLIDKEATGCSVACGFIYSPEFQAKKSTNEEYVSYMYSAFFGREAEKDGLDYWVTSLNDGMTRDDVFSGFTNSKEFGDLCDSYGVIRGCYIQNFDIDKTVKVNLFVERLYNVVLDRSCDNDGMTYWTTKLVSHEDTGAGVAAGFVFSPEFINKNYCDNHYVETLYASFMGRTPDKDGIDYWCSVLERGDSRENVFNGFACSPEFAGICSSYGIESGLITVSGNGTHSNGNCALCASADSTVVTNKPTTVPSAKPVSTQAPSKTPSNAPTPAQTSKPTVIPTNKPVANPTKTPSNKPSINPTKEPTKIPVKTPTVAPTLAPTKAPVATPTTVVTQVPTAVPSIIPTAIPTAVPVVPTAVVTVAPTIAPTAVPTAMPTPTPLTGLVYRDGEYYYYNSNGSLASGWITTNGAKYYFDNVTYKGLREWQFIGDKWYFFNNACQMQTGYLNHNGNMYFLNDDGSMYTGWKQFSSSFRDWYYFDPVDGYAHTGWVYDGDYYYMNPEDYKMVMGWQYVDGNWYYLSIIDGKMKHNCLLEINDASGVNLYYLEESGAMVVGWKQVNGNWYYFQESGSALRSGEYRIGDDYYYFNSNCQMLANGSANGHYYGSSGARVY